MILLLIIAVIVIIVALAYKKGNERTHQQQKIDVSELIKSHKAGYLVWSEEPANKYQLQYNSFNSDEYILKHKEEIIRIDNEIKEGYKAQAQKDEAFDSEQKRFSDKCYELFQSLLSGFGSCRYDIKWQKALPSGGRADKKYTVWQFFPNAVCFSQDLDYTYRSIEKDEINNIPRYQDMTLDWPDSKYDKINNFISSVARLSSRPLVVILVNYKMDYAREWSIESIEHHLRPIKRDTENTIVTTMTELDTKIESKGEQIEHVIIIDVYTQNHQIEKICNYVDDIFLPSHAAITYISLLKCYDRNEMEKLLEQAKNEAEQRRTHSLAETIKNNNSNGYERWAFSLELNGYRGDITDEMIVNAEEAITNHQQTFENERNATIDRIKEIASTWDHLTSDFTYKYLLRYYPTTCEFEATDAEWEDRYKVWNFKYDPQRVSAESNEEAMSWVINQAKSLLVESFGRESLPYLTLVCIPASSTMATERRYSEFSNKFCNATGMINAYSHIRVIQDATPRHLGGDGQAVLEYDEDFFQNKNVILFDDVITRGNSMLRMKAKLEELGATVIAGLTIGKTFHHRPT